MWGTRQIVTKGMVAVYDTSGRHEILTLRNTNLRSWKGDQGMASRRKTVRLHLVAFTTKIKTDLFHFGITSL